MTLDVERARRETPGCAQSLHFNNAGAALMPQTVLDAVVGHLALEAQIGGYEAEERAQPDLEHTYDAVAQLLHCRREEVAIVENATRAWDMAFYAIPFRPGDRILTTRTEYASNFIAFLQAVKRQGVQIEIVPDDAQGQVSLSVLRNALDARVKLIALTHVPTNNGLIQPAAEVGRLAREAGVLYLLDACQSAGQMPLDVQALGCDMLSATGRKFLRGPRGTGFLYVRNSILQALEPPFLDNHAATWEAPNRYIVRPDARRFETWETNVAGKIGLGRAVDYALEWGLDAIRARVVSLAQALRAQLSALPGVTVQDVGANLCGIVTFTLSGFAPQNLRAVLAERGIHVWVSRPTPLDSEREDAPEVVRASVHYYNTEAEVERFCDALLSLTGSAG
jgi:cysteine desulfurase/selenocysteine lyase